MGGWCLASQMAGLLAMLTLATVMATQWVLPTALQSAFSRVLMMARLCWGLLLGFQQACCSQVLRLALGRANLNLAGPTVR